MSIRELEQLRDDNLVGMMRALRQSGSGAGGTILAHEATLPEPDYDGLPVTLRRQIPQTWTDYNGHMNETHYLEAGSLASDRFMEMIGADAAYIAGGQSYFTAENHICYLNELKQGEMLTVTTQIIKGEGKKLHLFQRLYGADMTLAATLETFLIHIDLTARATSMPSDEVLEKMAVFAKAHADLPMPDGAGRYVGQR